MAGLLPHLIAGCALYLIGRVYYRKYFQGDNTIKQQLLLPVVCILFSLLPDLFLGIYYSTHIEPFDTFLPYQIISHILFIPLGICFLLILIIQADRKRRPIWIMGIVALILHVIMDLILQETSLFI
jgi:hypothetical protein